MGTRIQKLKNDLLSLFLKSNCPLCTRPTADEFCEYCHRQLLRSQLKNPSHFWQAELPIFAWGAYGGILKQAIAAVKYENQPHLARPLGHFLGEAWLQFPAATRIKKLTVVPIPLHPAKLQQRGFNQAELISRSFCEFTHYKHQPLGLERIRDTKAQFGLSGQEREQNLADAFVIGKSLSQHPPASPVLLVDDIYTTGATVRSAIKTLREQKIEVYGLVVLCASQQSFRLRGSGE